MKTAVDSMMLLREQADLITGQRTLRMLNGGGARRALVDSAGFHDQLTKVAGLTHARKSLPGTVVTAAARPSWLTDKTVVGRHLRARPDLTQIGASTAAVDAASVARNHFAQLPRWQRISGIDYVSKLHPALSETVSEQLGRTSVRAMAGVSHQTRVAEMARSIGQFANARSANGRRLVDELAAARRRRASEFMGRASYADVTLEALSGFDSHLGRRQFAARQLGAFDDLLKDLGVRGLASQPALSAQLSRLTQAQIGMSAGRRNHLDATLAMLSGADAGARAAGLASSRWGVDASAHVAQFARAAAHQLSVGRGSRALWERPWHVSSVFDYVDSVPDFEAVTRSQLDRLASNLTSFLGGETTPDLPWTEPASPAPAVLEPEPAATDELAGSDEPQAGPADNGQAASTHDAERLSRLRAMGMWVAEYPAWPLTRTLYLLPLQGAGQRLALLGAWVAALETSYEMIERATQPLEVSAVFTAAKLILAWSVLYYLAGREPESNT